MNNVVQLPIVKNGHRVNLQCVAVARDVENPKSIVVILNHELTDADFRMFGDVVAHALKVLSSVEAGDP